MIKIYNCDCMDYMKKCKDEQFDLAIVDPPYGINAEQGTNDITRAQFADKNAGWDSKPPDDEYFKELERVSKIQIIWGANHFRFPPSANFIIWDKGITCRSRAFSDCELAWVSPKVQGFGVSGGRVFDGGQGMVADNGHNTPARIHPTQKPIKLYKYILQKYAKNGYKIFDSHIGSGSIGIACHDLGYDLFGCELDLDYYNAAKKRIDIHQMQQTLF